MITNGKHVINWRKRTKQRMVDAFEGKCGICSYDCFLGGLEFHHLESEEKERCLSGMIVNPSAWSKIVIELRKCVCLCSRCHREVHGGVTQLPHGIPRFNEEFYEYRKAYSKEMNACPICGKEKWEGQKTCSYECAAQMARKYDWNKINLKEWLEKGFTIQNIANEMGCSWGAVKKRLFKEGLRK